VSTYALIHGAGSDAWYWHLVEPRLRSRGHDVVAVDLPCDDDSAGFEEYADVVVHAVGDRRDVVLVAQSLGGFTAPLVCDRLDVRLIVLVAAMVPRPGESAGEWWANTGHEFPDPFDPEVVFTHDLPPELAAASAEHVRPQSGAPFEQPWQLEAWPDVPTRFLLCRDDRFFPADFLRRVVRERLGIEPDEMSGGHLPALAHPDELVEWLERYRVELSRDRPISRS
jgi:pimeloyl-ACP methyl ester carboxylesterase